MTTSSIVFPTLEGAQSFVQGLLRDANSAMAGGGGASFIGGRANLSGLDLFNNLVEKSGGHIVRSSRRREQLVYQYQDHIFLEDRRYLALRDPTARYIIERPAIDTWFAPPKAFDPAIDRFVTDIFNLGFREAVVAADIAARRDGGAFLYINASGDPAEPIQSRDRVFGFDYIQVDQIPHRDAVHLDNTGNPDLMQHGIERVEFYPTIQHKNEGRLVTIHGSRLISMRDDPTVRWWLGRGVIDAVYDDLWNYRDVIFAQKQSQFMGNPVKVEVDWEAGFDVDDDEADTIKERISELRSGHRDSISPIQGLKVMRLGPPEMDDADTIVRALASRIANGTVFPVNMILASSRGSEQVTDQDFITYESEVQKRRDTHAHSILRHLFKVWQRIGGAPRRASFPLELRWKHLRVLNEREEALAVGNKAKTLNMAGAAGWVPPEWFTEGFTKNTEPIDPDLILPRRSVTENLNQNDDLDVPGPDDPEPTPRDIPDVSFCMDHLDEEEGRRSGCKDCLGEPE